MYGRLYNLKDRKNLSSYLKKKNSGNIIPVVARFQRQHDNAFPFSFPRSQVYAVYTQEIQHQNKLLVAELTIIQLLNKL